MKPAMKKQDKKTRLRPEDREIFRASVADVTPLPGRNRADLALRQPRPVPVQRLRDDHAVLQDSLSDRIPWDAGLETGEGQVPPYNMTMSLLAGWSRAKKSFNRTAAAGLL